MDFGRALTHQQLEAQDLSLADLVLAQGVILKKSTTQLYFGPPVYAEKSWVGRVYPQAAKPQDYLKHFASAFNSIEFNATHYNIPDERTVDKWLKSTHDHFRFAFKFPQSISHAVSWSRSLGETEKFLSQIARLESRIGCCFFQMPPSVSILSFDDLRAYCATWPRTFRFAIEFRHASWFQNRQLKPHVAKWMADSRFAAVCTDAAMRRDVSHGTVTTDFTLTRLLGNSGHESDATRLQLWAKRCATWQEVGVENIYFYLHQPENKDAPELSNLFADKIQVLTTLESRAFEPVGAKKQLTLF